MRKANLLKNRDAKFTGLRHFNAMMAGLPHTEETNDVKPRTRGKW